jgi:5-methylcytosine-specific restriction endonuclease McrA
MPLSNACPRQRPARLDKRAIALAKERQWVEVKRRVRERDKVCRVCRKPGYDVHHIEFRSRGGEDSMANCVLLCRQCHGDAHGHVLKLSGNAQTKKGLRIARWDDDASDWLWKAA